MTYESRGCLVFLFLSVTILLSVVYRSLFGVFKRWLNSHLFWILSTDWSSPLSIVFYYHSTFKSGYSFLTVGNKISLVHTYPSKFLTTTLTCTDGRKILRNLRSVLSLDWEDCTRDALLFEYSTRGTNGVNRRTYPCQRTVLFVSYHEGTSTPLTRVKTSSDVTLRLVVPLPSTNTHPTLVPGSHTPVLEEFPLKCFE